MNDTPFILGMLAVWGLLATACCAAYVLGYRVGARHEREPHTCTPSRSGMLYSTRRYQGVRYQDLESPRPVVRNVPVGQPTPQPQPMSRRQVAAHWRAVSGQWQQSQEVNHE